MKYKKSIEVITHELCKYGCGQIAKWQNQSGSFLCDSSAAKCPVIKQKNSDACKRSYKVGNRKSPKDIYENLSEEKKKAMNWNKGNCSAIFGYGEKGNHKLALIKEYGHICQSCNLSKWQEKDIPLELEHIDGNNKNNEKTNLKLLCPNCHALTPTWRGRNINSGKIKVTTDELILALSKSPSIRQALILVGLTPKGGNYARCNDLIYRGLAKLANAAALNPAES